MQRLIRHPCHTPASGYSTVKIWLTIEAPKGCLPKPGHCEKYLPRISHIICAAPLAVRERQSFAQTPAKLMKSFRFPCAEIVNETEGEMIMDTQEFLQMDKRLMLSRQA